MACVPFRGAVSEIDLDWQEPVWVLEDPVNLGAIRVAPESKAGVRRVETAEPDGLNPDELFEQLTLARQREPSPLPGSGPGYAGVEQEKAAGSRLGRFEISPKF